MPTTYDRQKFAAAIRAFVTPTSGHEAILDQWEEQFPHGPLKYLAYILATAHHETGAKMVPVEENLNYSAKRLVQVWPKRFPTVAAATLYANNGIALANKVYGGRMGNTAPNDGWLYRGRGLVQITGKDNYARASKALGIDFVAAPDLVMDKRISAGILFLGMIEGWFTGKKLSDYFDGIEADAIGARAIINGTDRAADIAALYRRYVQALLIAEQRVAAPPPPPAPAPEPEEVGKVLALVVKALRQIEPKATASRSAILLALEAIDDLVD